LASVYTFGYSKLFVVVQKLGITQRGREMLGKLFFYTVFV